MRPESVKQAGAFSTECNPASGNPCAAYARTRILQSQGFPVRERMPRTILHTLCVRERKPRTAAVEDLSSPSLSVHTVLPHGFMPRPSVFFPVRSGIPRTASCRIALYRGLS